MLLLPEPALEPDLSQPIPPPPAGRGEAPERRARTRNCSAPSFVPGLVHELRNFSFGLSASLDAFQARVAGQEGSRYGEAIRSSLDRLNAFVEELREFGDPQAYRWAPGELSPILRSAVNQVQPQAERGQVAVRLDVTGPLPPIRVDAERLRMAFIRLLDLAVQQEGPGGVLVMQVGCQDQGVLGHLDSPGVRLQDLDLARLFEPFYYRGSGLGRLALPVARRVVEAHGGSLRASPGPAGGVRIDFTLPGF